MLQAVYRQHIPPYSPPCYSICQAHIVCQTGYVNYQIESQSENLTHIINQMGMNGMCTIQDYFKSNLKSIRFDFRF